MAAINHTILVGDIGGTNSRLALATRAVDKSAPPEIHTFWKARNDDYSSFDEVLGAFRNQHDEDLPKRAVIAIAGPVSNNQTEMTNRGWIIDGAALETRFGFARVDLINDFVAMARSAPELLASQQTEIIHGVPAPGAFAIAGAGTGFGQAVLSPLGDDWFVLPGQGGHRAFSPRTEIEFELTRRLMDMLGYVSIEAVAGGVHYNSLLAALQDIHGVAREDIAPADCLVLANKNDTVCQSLCQIRANTIMTASGDAVLSSLARGGLMLAGGVTEWLIDYIRTPEAISRFRERGPMTAFMDTVPVKLITCPEAPLIGAAAYEVLNS